MPETRGQPTLPTHPSNPVGGTAIINRSERATFRALRSVQDWLIETLKGWPVRKYTVNSLRANAEVYEYLVDPAIITSTLSQLNRRLSSDDVTQPVVAGSVAGYEAGTGAVVVSLQGLTSNYTRTVESVMTSQPWQRRSALIRARVFEQMQGFAGETAADLSRVLMTGVENGQNPLVVAKNIEARFNVSRSRAERIARTEITGALRRARWDESESASVDLGVHTRQLWLSALSPTTRPWHSARHGGLYTVQDVQEFYTRDANGINCKCSQTPVLVDENGQPYDTKVIDRVRAKRPKTSDRKG